MKGAKDDEKPRTVLAERDDPQGKARKVEKEWTVTEKVVLLARRDNGKLVPCDHYEIHEGDFVDVTFGFDIVTPPGTRTVLVTLSPKKVVRLSTADRGKKVRLHSHDKNGAKTDKGIV